MPSLTEVLIMIDLSLTVRPCASTDIDLVYYILGNNLQLAIYRGYPFEMMIMQIKIYGDPLTFSFRVDDISLKKNNYGPYMYVSNGSKRNRSRYVCSQGNGIQNQTPHENGSDTVKGNSNVVAMFPSRVAVVGC